MARVIAEAPYIGIRGVVRICIAIDKVALTGGVEEFGEEFVALAISSVKMGDGDAVGRGC